MIIRTLPFYHIVSHFTYVYIYAIIYIHNIQCNTYIYIPLYIPSYPITSHCIPWRPACQLPQRTPGLRRSGHELRLAVPLQRFPTGSPGSAGGVKNKHQAPAIDGWDWLHRWVFHSSKWWSFSKVWVSLFKDLRPTFECLTQLGSINSFYIEQVLVWSNFGIMIPCGRNWKPSTQFEPHRFRRAAATTDCQCGCRPGEMFRVFPGSLIFPKIQQRYVLDGSGWFRMVLVAGW